MVNTHKLTTVVLISISMLMMMMITVLFSMNPVSAQSNEIDCNQFGSGTQEYSDCLAQFGNITGSGSCASNFLGLPTWHKYLTKDGDCNIVSIVGDDPGTPNVDESKYFVTKGQVPWLIGAAVVEMIARIATYVAVIFVFVGGYQILASSGNPESVAGGRKKMVAAIVGFIIAITATSIVGFLVAELAGSAPTTAAGLPDVSADGGRSVVNSILSIAYRIAAGLAVIYTAIAGIQFASSGGDPGRVAKARNNVMYAAIGLVVVIFSVAIIAFIGGQL